MRYGLKSSLSELRGIRKRIFLAAAWPPLIAGAIIIRRLFPDDIPFRHSAVDPVDLIIISGTVSITAVFIYTVMEFARAIRAIRDIAEENTPSKKTASRPADIIAQTVSLMRSRIKLTEIITGTIPNSVLIMDNEGRIIQANNSCRIMFCPDNDIVGLSVTEILAAEFMGRRLSDMLIRAVTEGQTSLYWEGICIDTRFPVFVQIQTISLEGSEFLLCVVTDISDMKNAADEISFRSALLDNAFDSILASRPDGRIIYANMECCRLHQYSMDQILALSSEELVFPTSIPDYLASKAKLADTPSLTFELWHRRRNGTFVPVETHCAKVLFNNETIIIENHHDLTTIKANQHALRESEARFRSFFDNAKDCVFIATSNGYLLNINHAGRKLLDIGSIKPDEIDLFSFFIDDGERARFSEMISSYGFVKDFKTGFKRGNGAVLNVEINATFFHNPLYHITGYNGFIRDTTHENMMESQVRQAQKLDAIGRLAGGVAHDFNNILTIIIGNTELALASTDDEEIREPIIEIKSSAERAAKLTTQLLAFSRKQITMPEIIMADRMLRDLHKILNRIIGENIALELDLDADNCPIKIDRSQFEQIILNLVVNARDAINERNRPSDGRIIIKTRSGSSVNEFIHANDPQDNTDYFQLSISDNGVGIPENNIDKIFDPFFTTKGPDRGTGLGLATVFGIITQNNAKIIVKSSGEAGTEFIVLWPECKEIIEETGTDEKIELSPHGTESILIVEDEPSLCAFTLNSLTRFGYTCVSASNYEEAIDQMNSSEGIDLAFIDIVLPGKGGITLAKELTRINPGLTVMLTSGYPEKSIDGETVPAEWDIIRKPYNVNDLLRHVRKALDLKKTRQRL